MLGELSEAGQLIATNLASPAPRFANTTGRAFFLSAVIAELEGAPVAAAIGRLKAMLKGPPLPVTPDVAARWDMRYFIDHLRGRLPENTVDLLAAVVSALDDPRALPDLERFAAWRDAGDASPEPEAPA
jgi:hypothetical protein